MKKRYNTTKLFFTSDLHINHENIIKETHDNRPFDDVEHMQREIIKNIQETVPKDNILVLVGDTFTIRKLTGKIKIEIEDFFDRLDRTIIHIKGNHDDFDLSFSKHVLYSCEILNLSVKLSDGTRQKMCISHYPIKTWDCKHYGSIHVYGHLHYGPNNIFTKIKKYFQKIFKNKSERSINVGIMNTDYKPLSFDDVYKKTVENEI